MIFILNLSNQISDPMGRANSEEKRTVGIFFPALPKQDISIDDHLSAMDKKREEFPFYFSKKNLYKTLET